MPGRNRKGDDDTVPPPVVGTVSGWALVALAILLERDDPAAFGDNYIGLTLLVPFFIVAIVQYRTTEQLMSASGTAKQPA